MKVEEKFPQITEFENLLNEAEGNASNDWEEEFTSDIRARYEKYGAGMFISDKQLEKLERIAEGENTF